MNNVHLRNNINSALYTVCAFHLYLNLIYLFNLSLYGYSY